MQKLLDKDGELIGEDPWQVVCSDQEPPQDKEHLLLPLDLWLERDKTGHRRPSWGVWLNSDDEVEALSGRYSELPCIAIHFPAFMDGRGFSSARMIREHYGYRGPLRALGRIIPEQLLFLARCGFDSFVVDAERNIPDPRVYFDEFSVNYQASADQPEPLFRRRA